MTNGRGKPCETCWTHTHTDFGVNRAELNVYDERDLNQHPGESYVSVSTHDQYEERLLYSP